MPSPQQNWIEKHREQWRKYNREWSRKHPELNRERQKRFRAKHPEYEKAHNEARKIPLASNCQICGSTENLERHHSDYSKPLEIATLCKSCHILIHKLRL